MPRNNIDDFIDAICYTAQTVCRLQSQTTIYDDEFDESLTGSWGARPLPRDFSNEWAYRFVSDIQTEKSYIQAARKTDIDVMACEVCGEPTGDLRYHICQRCRAADKKFKDC